MKTRLERQLRRTSAGAVLAAVWICGCTIVSPRTEQVAVSKTAAYDVARYVGIGCTSGEMRSTQEEPDGAAQAMNSEDGQTDGPPAGPTQVDPELAVARAGSADVRSTAGAMREFSRMRPAEDVCNSP